LNAGRTHIPETHFIKEKKMSQPILVTGAAGVEHKVPQDAK
jgi:hypothetical protein